MSDKNKNMKYGLPEFLRYQKGDMSGEERNSFEKELQKDPFAEDASEGFASESQADVLKDISKLQKILKIRTARKRRFTVYRIAASVAVLMVISSVFIIVEKNKSSGKISETSSSPEPIEIFKDKPVKEPVAKDESPAMPAGKDFKKANEGVVIKDAREAEKSVANHAGDQVSENKLKGFAENAAAGKAAQPSESTSARKTLSVQEMVTDSQMLAAADTTLNEVVVVGYGTKRAQMAKNEATAGYVPPRPVNGKQAFDKYINDNLVRPDKFAAGQRAVVIVRFAVHTNGIVDSIMIVRSPGKPFSDEAIRLIQSGPSWKPAEDSGKPIEDSVRLRIIFK